MIPAERKDDAFLEDVDRAAERQDALHLWWLGQSGFLVCWEGCFLLLDPYLSDSLTAKYAGTDKPHVRLSERVVAPERLGFVDLVTSSHNHTDHLDAATLGPLLAVNPDLTVVVPRANLAFAAARLGVPAARLTAIAVDGDPVTLAPFCLHALPAAHETLERDEAGDDRAIGLVVEVGPWALYHSGDTVRYDGLAERLRAWHLDLALLPINGRDPARGVPGNLSGPEAVALARDVGVDLVVPCHYDTFAFNTVSPEAFRAAAEAAGQRYRILRGGGRLTLEASTL